MQKRNKYNFIPSKEIMYNFQNKRVFKKKDYSLCKIFNSTSKKPNIYSIIYNNLKHYSVNIRQYNVLLINSIIFDQRNHIVAEFKNFLLWDESSEFLKRFYRKDETRDRLPKIADYYERYTLFSPIYFGFDGSILIIMKKWYRKKRKYYEYIEDQEELLEENKNKIKNWNFEPIISESKLLDINNHDDKDINGKNNTLNLTKYESDSLIIKIYYNKTKLKNSIKNIIKDNKHNKRNDDNSNLYKYNRYLTAVNSTSKLNNKNVKNNKGKIQRKPTNSRNDNNINKQIYKKDNNNNNFKEGNNENKNNELNEDYTQLKSMSLCEIIDDLSSHFSIVTNVNNKEEKKKANIKMMNNIKANNTKKQVKRRQINNIINKYKYNNQPNTERIGIIKSTYGNDNEKTNKKKNNNNSFNNKTEPKRRNNMEFQSKEKENKENQMKKVKPHKISKIISLNSGDFKKSKTSKNNNEKTNLVQKGRVLKIIKKGKKPQSNKDKILDSLTNDLTNLNSPNNLTRNDNKNDLDNYIKNVKITDYSNKLSRDSNIAVTNEKYRKINSDVYYTNKNDSIIKTKSEKINLVNGYKNPLNSLQNIISSNISNNMIKAHKNRVFENLFDRNIKDIPILNMKYINSNNKIRKEKGFYTSRDNISVKNGFNNYPREKSKRKSINLNSNYHIKKLELERNNSIRARLKIPLNTLPNSMNNSKYVNKETNSNIQINTKPNVNATYFRGKNKNRLVLCQNSLKKKIISLNTPYYTQNSGLYTKSSESFKKVSSDISGNSRNSNLNKSCKSSLNKNRQKINLNFNFNFNFNINFDKNKRKNTLLKKRICEGIKN